MAKKKKLITWSSKEDKLISAFVGIAALATGTPLNIRECLERATLAINYTFHDNKSVRTFGAVQQRYYSDNIRNSTLQIFGYENVKTNTRFKHRVERGDFKPRKKVIGGKDYILEVNLRPAFM